MIRPDLISKARELLNRNLVTTTISTADSNGYVDTAIVNSARMLDDTTIAIARVSIKRSYDNLLQNPKAVFAVILPGETSRDTDGIRIYTNMVCNQKDGPGFEEMNCWLRETFGLKARNRLLFKITEIRSILE